MDISIYVLRDPDTNEPRYIGKALNPKRRFAQHLGPSSLSGRTHKSKWLAALAREGKRPVLAVLQLVRAEDWSAAEKHYVAEFKALGARLTNGDDGGLSGQTGPESRSRYLKRLLSKGTPTSFDSGSTPLRLGMQSGCERFTSCDQISCRKSGRPLDLTVPDLMPSTSQGNLIL